jgi:DNA-binding FadR family transcriptional regulator
VNAGPTGERVYEALKRHILSLDVRPGDHLDPGQLGDMLASSATPVREALNILLGEGLVEARGGSGFHLPRIDSPMVEDLYEWSGSVMALALRHWPSTPTAIPAATVATPVAVADLFAAIAQRSSNAEHLRAISGLNDRLAPFRDCEATLFAQHSDEIDAMRRAFVEDRQPELRQALAGYHRQRRKHATALVRARYRHGA